MIEIKLNQSHLGVRIVQDTGKIDDEKKPILRHGKIKAYDNTTLVLWVIFDSEEALEHPTNWLDAKSEKVKYSEVSLFNKT